MSENPKNELCECGHVRSCHFVVNALFDEGEEEYGCDFPYCDCEEFRPTGKFSEGGNR
jgi:hypothetical protein